MVSVSVSVHALREVSLSLMCARARPPCSLLYAGYLLRVAAFSILPPSEFVRVRAPEKEREVHGCCDLRKQLPPVAKAGTTPETRQWVTGWCFLYVLVPQSGNEAWTSGLRSNRLSSEGQKGLCSPVTCHHTCTGCQRLKLLQTGFLSPFFYPVHMMI